MKTVKIFYGLSGSFKSSMIEKYKKDNPESLIIRSKIKDWKNYEQGLFKGLTVYSDVTYGILHLIGLRDIINMEIKGDIMIERGITDSLFYHFYKGNDLDSTLIVEAVKEEKKLLLPDFYKIEKILLVQRDLDFIKNNVLVNPYRGKVFNNNVDNYMKMQDQYVEFTKKYNQFNKVYDITDARWFIENELKVQFKK